MTGVNPNITTWGCDEGHDLDSRPYPPKCFTCRDRGLIIVRDYQGCEDDAPCPDCKAHDQRTKV